jgi:DNA-binding SARP family transcriptional activator
MPMDVRLLGTVEVCADGIVPLLGGPKQRAVLADLALHAGQILPTAQLIDDLWGEQPPASAKSTLESYISRLRQVLSTSGPDGPVLVTRPAGYMLDGAPEHVDAWQFRDLAARGKAAAGRGDAVAAAEALALALALWRGPALADIRAVPFAVRAGQRLEDERLAAAEILVDMRLRLGHHRELVPELEMLTAGSPYRECFRAQLMLALYRSGRQADALAAFSRARDVLTGELGIEPGRELRELEQAILLQAPELEPAGDPMTRRDLQPSAGVPVPVA